MIERKNIYLAISILTVLVLMSGVISAEVSGAVTSPGAPSRSTSSDAPEDVWAYAGNITEVDISGVSTTQGWQGYFGNVSGVITLTDVNNNTLYNWSLASPRGEIYASTNQSIAWQYLQCFNFTADGNYDPLDLTRQGATSQNGTNLTMLETMFGMNPSDADGIVNTFTFSGASGHEEFYSGSLNFSLGECKSTRVFTASGGQDNKFEEALLYEPSSTSIVFTTILNQDIVGFDSGYHDFEMLVLENGHQADTTAVKYYFYVELG